MHIEKYTVYHKPYLRLVQSRRKTTKSGKEISGKELILGLGALEKYDDGQPNYLERLRASFRDGNPLIEALKPFVESAPKNTVTITFKEGDPKCFGTPKRMAPCILDGVFSGLGLDSLFASIKHEQGIKYDLQGIVRLLTYGRLLDPASKIATMSQNDSYFRPLVKNATENNVYDALDLIYENSKKIIQRMNTMITKGIGARTGTVFYDVTNFFFEVERPDEDEVDPSGNVLEKGLRKMGVSKENRKQPIVQLGLFLDENGIPISFGMFPGNTLDHATLRPAMKETVDTLEMGRFILIADRGMYSGINMLHVKDAGNGYIVSKSLKKSGKEDIDWALLDEGYTKENENFRYKSKEVERVVIGEDGTKRTFKEKVVVYWSRSYYEREQNDNKSFLDFVKKLQANPAGFRITAMQSQSLRKFMKKDVVNRKTGDILDGTKLIAMIDEEKLKQFNALMGYDQIVTSELTLTAKEIIEKYHGLTQIEDQFREMKGTLETRPIYVRTPSHIHAHLMICFIALTMMRLIQHKTKKELCETDNTDHHWSYGLSGTRIKNALANWLSNELPGSYFQMLNVTGEDIQHILKAFGVSIPAKLYSKGDIRDIKSSVTPFDK